MSNSQKMTAAIFLGMCILFLDVLSKGWVNAHLPLMQPYGYPYGGIPVFKNFFGIEFSINHLTNQGAAWGALGGYQPYLVSMRILLIIGMTLYIGYFNQRRSWTFPLILIISGAIGNVVDYFLYGHVVDMLHVVLWGYDFPVFNIADSAVSIGIFWLLFLTPSELGEEAVLSEKK
jgi:signal peptidase II